MVAAPDYPLLVLAPQGMPTRPWIGVAVRCSLATIAIAISSSSPRWEVDLGNLTVALLRGLVIGNAMPARIDSWSTGVEVTKEQFLSRYVRGQSDSNTCLSVVEALAASAARSSRTPR